MGSKTQKIGHYSSLLLLEQAVVDAKYSKFHGFVAYYKKRLLDIFSTFDIEEDIDKINREEFVSILKKTIDDFSVEVQQEKQFAPKSRVRLDENMAKELAFNRTWKDTIQLCYSDPKYYVKEISCPEDFIVVPSRITPLMLQRLGIDRLDVDCRNFKEKLLQFRPLEYTKQIDHGSEKAKTHQSYVVSTDRIGDIGGVPVSTQILRTVYEVVFGQPTKGEERKSKYSANVSAYTNVYSLMRGQQSTLDGINKQIDQTDELLDGIKDILSPVFNDMDKEILDIKSMNETKILQDLMYEIRHATSFFLMSSKMYRFQKVSGKNKSIDKNLLVGATHDISNRRKQLLGIAMKVGEHFDVLESRLEKNEEAVTTLVAELASLFYIRVQPGKPIPYDEFNQALIKYIHTSDKYKLSMKPFSSFLDKVKDRYGGIRDGRKSREIELINPVCSTGQLRFLEVLFLSLAKCFAANTLEHKLKLQDEFQVPSFDELQNIFFYNQIVQLFAELEVSVPADTIQEISKMFFPHLSEQFIQLSKVGSDKEKIYPILQDMQK